MLTWIRRYEALKQVELRSEDSRILFHKNVEFRVRKTSRILIDGGEFRVGYALPGTTSYSQYPKTIIDLSEDSELQVNGNVSLAGGTCIKIGQGAKLTFEGGNLIAHNCLIICTNEIVFGRNTSCSWGCTFIDEDKHVFFNEKGQQLRRFEKPLIIGKNVGIQMNVVVPRGVTIGDYSVISANTVIRENISPYCLVYNEQKLKVHEGISSEPFI